MRHAVVACAALLWAALRADAAEPPATAWILQRDGRVLAQHRADDPVPVASLAKLLAAVVWLQRPERLQQAVVVSPRAAGATGARAGLKAGERLRGGDLLSALLVRSANDACLAMAEQAGGTVEAFVADLNRAAQSLQLHSTHLENPCGWDAPGQRSSARDVLRIAETAMALPEVRDRVALRVFTLRTIDGDAPRKLRNTNLLLDQLPGTVGVKTGFTAQAGKCLVALTEREGVQVWLVLLGARERWWTAHRSMESAFRAGPAR